MFSEITVEIKMKWWLRYLYLPLLYWFYGFCKRWVSLDCELNDERVHNTIRKGLISKVIK